MWQSEHNKKKRVVSSSSSSSRSYYSSSSSSSMVPQNPTRRTMDEVWKEITLATLHHDRRPITAEQQQIQRPHPTASPSFRGMILQDFLAGPFKETPAAAAAEKDLTLPPPPQPPTVLSLNSGMELQYMVGSSAVQPPVTHSNTNSNSDTNSDNHNVPFISPSFSNANFGSPPPTGLFCFCPKKRVLETPDISGGDLRHKRMIKNRESAARSRARKQAHANELELEVAHLAEENSSLKKQYEELRLAMAAQLNTKKTLQRTSTAPF